MKKNNLKNSVKHIIFDLGDVVVDIDFNRAIDAFVKLGMKDFGSMFNHASQVNLFDRMDRGEVSPQEFRDELREIAGLSVGDEQIDQAWNAIIVGLPRHRLQLLNEVRKNYKTYLLSNTNAIHMKTFGGMLKNEFGSNGIENYFDRAYLSFKLGMRKPEERIFQHVIEDTNLDVSETFFIDDSPQHIKAAAGLGINTYLFKPGEEKLEDLFDKAYLLQNTQHIIQGR